jgi:hypothetical protein
MFQNYTSHIFTKQYKIRLATGARKGNIIEYFESDSKEGYSLNAQNIGFRKYKIMLWKAVKNILEIAGYDISMIENELVLNDMKKNMATNQSHKHRSSDVSPAEYFYRIINL